MGRVEDIANTAMFLLDSRIASFFTAQYITPDGGGYAGNGVVTLSSEQKKSLCPN